MPYRNIALVLIEVKDRNAQAGNLSETKKICKTFFFWVDEIHFPETQNVSFVRVLLTQLAYESLHVPYIYFTTLRIKITGLAKVLAEIKEISFLYDVTGYVM
jgi:hypothetical protein